MQKFEQKVMIKENHLDLFGHVNNAVYLEIFEEVRWDLIVSRGFDVAHIQKTKTGPVILEVNIKFLHELKARDLVTVTMEALPQEAGANPKIYKLRQQMITENKVIACEAIFTYALFDLEKRKLLAPTPEWMKAVGL